MYVLDCKLLKINTWLRIQIWLKLLLRKLKSFTLFDSQVLLRIINVSLCCLAVYTFHAVGLGKSCRGLTMAVAASLVVSSLSRCRWKWPISTWSCCFPHLWSLDRTHRGLLRPPLGGHSPRMPSSSCPRSCNGYPCSHGKVGEDSWLYHWSWSIYSR